jgi:SEC-C motif
MLGRNEQCPCGSAVKYKRCCLPLVDAAVRELRARDSIFAGIVDWLKDEHEAALEEASHETALIRILRGAAGRNMSAIWAIEDFRPSDSGPPLMARFAAREELDPGTREIVRGLCDAALDVFRITEAISDQWIVLEPLRGGERIRVVTDGGFASLEIGEILIARVVHGTSVPTIWGLVMRFPATSQRRWLARLEHLPAERAEAALAVLAFHPDDAVEPLPEHIDVIDVRWPSVDGDAVLDALEVDPLFECLGQAIPDGWAFSWLDDVECGGVDLGGRLESDDQIEVARLVVRETDMTLISSDRETLQFAASHVEQELGDLIAPVRIPRAA